MARITRETLLRNLGEHDVKTEARHSGAWDRLMVMFDAATKSGTRSVSFAHGGGEFSLDEAEYIKQRAVEEGYRWRLSFPDRDDYDGYAFVVIEL